jgi:hypothetical protein
VGILRDRQERSFPEGDATRSQIIPFQVAYPFLFMGDFQPEHGQKVNACLEKSKHAGDVTGTEKCNSDGWKTFLILDPLIRRIRRRL